MGAHHWFSVANSLRYSDAYPVASFTPPTNQPDVSREFQHKPAVIGGPYFRQADLDCHDGNPRHAKKTWWVYGEVNPCTCPSYMFTCLNNACEPGFTTSSNNFFRSTVLAEPSLDELKAAACWNHRQKQVAIFIFVVISLVFFPSLSMFVLFYLV